MGNSRLALLKGVMVKDKKVEFDGEGAGLRKMKVGGGLGRFNFDKNIRFNGTAGFVEVSEQIFENEGIAREDLPSNADEVKDLTPKFVEFLFPVRAQRIAWDPEFGVNSETVAASSATTVAGSILGIAIAGLMVLFM
jgi:hypothetical protein